MSSTSFHTEGAPQGFDRQACVFKQNSADELFYLTIAGLHGGALFDRVKLVDPTLDELKKYIGSYYCDELSTTYQFSIRDNALWIRVNSRGWEQLEPTSRDTFIPHVRLEQDSRFFNFHRNEANQDTGFDIDYFEVQDLQFAKQPVP